jgi:ribosome-binding factor A
MRVVRVNELIKRELSALLHTRYQEQAVRITLSDVEVAPGLRSATVYYTVVGTAADVAAAGRFFARERTETAPPARQPHRVEYLPHLSFRHDSSLERGSRLNNLMDEMGLEGPWTSPRRKPRTDTCPSRTSSRKKAPTLRPHSSSSRDTRSSCWAMCGPTATASARRWR